MVKDALIFLRDGLKSQVERGYDKVRIFYRKFIEV